MGKTVFVDLTHPFSAEIPRWPYFDKPDIVGAHSMAKGGVLTQRITCTMHTGTHCDAPRHVMEYELDGRRARYTHEMPIDAYTGDAVVDGIFEESKTQSAPYFDLKIDGITRLNEKF